MQLYSRDDYLEEKNRVWAYVQRRAIDKKYPKEYLSELQPLYEKLYHLSRVIKCDTVMLNQPEVLEASEYAQTKHEGQLRQFIELPYIVHPREVATRASAYVELEAVQAALLHDVVEDCGVSLSEIVDIYGEKVAHHVYYLTDPATEGNRAQRLAANFEHFKLSDTQTQNVKLCDLISNSRSIALCAPGFAEVYVPELKTMDEYFMRQSALNDELVSTIHEITAVSEDVVRLQQVLSIVKLDKKKTKTVTL